MSLDSMDRSVVSLERATTVKDPSGGYTQNFSTVASGLTADVQPVSATIAIQYLERQMQISHTIYLVNDCGALPEDRFVLAGPPIRYFKVMGYRPGAPGYDQWPSEADVMEQR